MKGCTNPYAFRSNPAPAWQSLGLPSDRREKVVDSKEASLKMSYKDCQQFTIWIYDLTTDVESQERIL